jgi:hypothetical protein
LTLPGRGISTGTAMLWELVLTVGLVSTILGTASGAQNLRAIAALGVGGYIALAALWGSPVSGASMNTAPDANTNPEPDSNDVVGLKRCARARLDALPGSQSRTTWVSRMVERQSP